MNTALILINLIKIKAFEAYNFIILFFNIILVKITLLIKFYLTV
jgi:hypothetical protein